jgi:signal transduction histidine kinase
MRSVFNNLLDNAVKYTPENGHVQVSLAGDGLYVKVAVKDDGIGLSPQDKEKLFEEFFRAKNKYTAQVPGTGLGLSLVKRLVGLHQGTVSVQTASGKGSEFVVCLPVTE